MSYTKANKYNAFCFQCRKLAGMEPAGIPEDDLCEYHGREESTRIRAELAAKDKEIERLKEQLRLTNIDWQNAEAENAALREEINNPKRTFCAWCGYTVEIDDDAATGIAEHVRTCEKHPLNIEIDALRERLRPVEEVYKKHEVWAREWLSTAPVSSRSRMLEFWQAICKTMEGK